VRLEFKIGITMFERWAENFWRLNEMEWKDRHSLKSVELQLKVIGPMLVVFGAIAAFAVWVSHWH